MPRDVLRSFFLFLNLRVTKGSSLFAVFEPPIEMLEAVKATLNEALNVRRESAEAFSSLGLTQIMAWQWEGAWKNLNRARELSSAKTPDGSLATTELGFALYYAALHEPEKVKAALQRANELDPLNVEMADWGNWALFLVGETEAARNWAEEKLAQHPTSAVVTSGAAVGAYLRGDLQRSVELAEKGAQLMSARHSD